MNLSEAEIMLCLWGRWHRGSGHLGISSINIIGRCIAEGAGASHTTIQVLPDMGPIVETVEQCVLGMGKPLQRVCKHKWIGEETDRTAAKKLRVTLDVYQTWTNQAVKVVAEYVKIN